MWLLFGSFLFGIVCLLVSKGYSHWIKSRLLAVTPKEEPKPEEPKVAEKPDTRAAYLGLDSVVIKKEELLKPPKNSQRGLFYLEIGDSIIVVNHSNLTYRNRKGKVVGKYNACYWDIELFATPDQAATRVNMVRTDVLQPLLQEGDRVKIGGTFNELGDDAGREGKLVNFNCPSIWMVALDKTETHCAKDILCDIGWLHKLPKAPKEEIPKQLPPQLDSLQPGDRVEIINTNSMYYKHVGKLMGCHKYDDEYYWDIQIYHATNETSHIDSAQMSGSWLRRISLRVGDTVSSSCPGFLGRKGTILSRANDLWNVALLYDGFPATTQKFSEHWLTRVHS